MATLVLHVQDRKRSTSDRTLSHRMQRLSRSQNLDAGSTMAPPSSSSTSATTTTTQSSSNTSSLMLQHRLVRIDFRKEDIPEGAVYVRTRHNSLRCFPRCSPIHKRKSFCGYPLYVTVYIDSNQLPVEVQQQLKSGSAGYEGSGAAVNDLQLAMVGEFRNVNKDARFSLGSQQHQLPAVTLSEFAHSGMLMRSTSVSSAGEASTESGSKRKSPANPPYFVARLYKHEFESVTGKMALNYIFMPPGKWHCQGKMREIDDHVFTASLVVDGRVVAQQDSTTFRIKRIWKLPGQSSSLEDEEDEEEEEMCGEGEEGDDVESNSSSVRRKKRTDSSSSQFSSLSKMQSPKRNRAATATAALTLREDNPMEDVVVASKPRTASYDSGAGLRRAPSMVSRPPPFGSGMLQPADPAHPFYTSSPADMFGTPPSMMLHAMIQQHQHQLLVMHQQHQQAQVQGSVSPMMDDCSVTSGSTQSTFGFTTPMPSPGGSNSMIPGLPYYSYLPAGYPSAASPSAAGMRMNMYGAGGSVPRGPSQQEQLASMMQMHTAMMQQRQGEGQQPDQMNAARGRSKGANEQ